MRGHARTGEAPRGRCINFIFMMAQARVRGCVRASAHGCRVQACARTPIRVQAMRRGTDAWGKTPEKRVVVVPNFDNFDSAWTTTIPRQITIIQSKSAKNLDIARYRGHETRLLELPILNSYSGFWENYELELELVILVELYDLGCQI